MPVHALLDRSVSFLREGYPFFERRRQQWRDETFETRILGRRAVCLRGKEAAEFFYDPSRTRSTRVVPWPTALTLFGPGAIHAMPGGKEHGHRKAMFLSVTADPDRLQRLAVLAGEGFSSASQRWQADGRVILFDEAVTTIGEVVFRWGGVPLDRDSPARARDLATIVDGFGSAGLRLLRAARARRRADRWARRLVRQVRSGALLPPSGTALATVAAHRDLDGNLLDERTAAVELLNILRPTVAVAWFVAFAGLALHHHPEYTERLRAGDPDLLENFALEVRRLYPFAPALSDRVRGGAQWRGRMLPRGRMVVLDLYGTCHDPAEWPEPERFNPERFAGGQPDPYAYIPHGGGEVASSHRCAGERVAMIVLKAAVAALTRLDYTVGPQDLSYPLNRMPTRPRSGVVLTDVRSVTGSPPVPPSS